MRHASQRGAVLIVALVMLAVLTLVGTVTLAVTTVDTRITANALDRRQAMGAGESALARSEAEMLGSKDVTGLSAYDGTLATPGWWRTLPAGAWAGKGVVTFQNGATAYYIIEPGTVLKNEPNTAVTDLGLGYIKPKYTAYRTTARAEGPGGALVYVQSRFIKKQQNNAP